MNNFKFLVLILSSSSIFTTITELIGHREAFRENPLRKTLHLRCLTEFLTFKRQSYKMVKHTYSTRRQIAGELFESVGPFREIGVKRVNTPLAR